MPEQPKQLRGLVSANVAVLLFGLAGVLGKLSLLPAPLIVFGRSFFAGLVLLAVCWFRHISLRPKRSRDSYLLLGQGVLLALHWTAFFQAINVSNVAIGLLSFRAFHFLLPSWNLFCCINVPVAYRLWQPCLSYQEYTCLFPLFRCKSNDAWGYVGGTFRSLIRAAFCHEPLAWTNLFESHDQPVPGRNSRDCPFTNFLLYSDWFLLDTSCTSHSVHSWSCMHSAGSYPLYCKYA